MFRRKSMPFTIYKDDRKGSRYFKLLKTLHVTADGRAVEENDPAGIRVLGSEGGLVSEEDAEKYGLDDSQVEAEEAYRPPAAEEKAEPESVGVVEVPEDLKGKLPEDFPGHASLDAAGIHTYAQLRKAGDVTEVKGIGEATAVKIAEALAALGDESE
jgi:hypothetical protein